MFLLLESYIHFCEQFKGVDEAAMLLEIPTKYIANNKLQRL